MSLSQSQAFQMLQNTPAFPVMAAALDAHVREHLAFQYRQDVEKQMGIPLPTEGEVLPADVEKRLSPLIAAAASQMSIAQAKIAEMQKNEALLQDPIVMQKEKELQIRAADVQRKAQEAAAKINQAAQNSAARNAIEVERIRAQERMAQAAVQQRMIDTVISAETDRKQIDSAEVQKGVDVGLEIGRRLSGE